MKNLCMYCTVKINGRIGIRIQKIIGIPHPSKNVVQYVCWDPEFRNKVKNNVVNECCVHYEIFIGWTIWKKCFQWIRNSLCRIIITSIITFITSIVSIIVSITQAPSNIDLLEPGFCPTLGLPAWTTCNPKRRYQVWRQVAELRRYAEFIGFGGKRSQEPRFFVSCRLLWTVGQSWA